MPARTAAVVGAAGGVGTTRLTVAFGAAMARAGEDVAVLDAAFATQGLSHHVPGRLDPDLTAVLSGDASLADALVEHPAADEVTGRLAVAPAHAPFARLARAMTPDAGERFADLVGTTEFDAVLVDVPPLASNPAVAAVTAADRVAVVTAPTERGLDALQQQRGRIADVGAGVDLVVANRTDAVPRDADLGIPESATTGVPDVPAPLGDGSAYAAAVVDAAAALFDVALDVNASGGVLDAARRLR